MTAESITRDLAKALDDFIHGCEQIRERLDSAYGDHTPDEPDDLEPGDIRCQWNQRGRGQCKLREGHEGGHVPLNPRAENEPAPDPEPGRCGWHDDNGRRCEYENDHDPAFDHAHGHHRRADSYRFNGWEFVQDGHGVRRQADHYGDGRRTWIAFDGSRELNDAELAATGDVRRLELIAVPNEIDTRVIEFGPSGDRVGLVGSNVSIQRDSLRLIVEQLLAAEPGLQYPPDWSVTPF
jgi:hypothetical protein